jgi:hypothetical protein
MFHTLRSFKPQTATEQSAYDRWMDQTAQREQARVARVHGAEGIIPVPVWFALFFISGVIVVYMLFFADPGEGAITQGVLMGGNRGDHAADPPADVPRSSTRQRVGQAATHRHATIPPHHRC